MNLQKADGALPPAEFGAEHTHSLRRERLRVKPKPVRDASSAAQQHTVLFPWRDDACLPRLPSVPLPLGAAAISSLVELR